MGDAAGTGTRGVGPGVSKGVGVDEGFAKAGNVVLRVAAQINAARTRSPRITAAHKPYRASVLARVMAAGFLLCLAFFGMIWLLQ